MMRVMGDAAVVPVSPDTSGNEMNTDAENDDKDEEGEEVDDKKEECPEFPHVNDLKIAPENYCTSIHVANEPHSENDNDGQSTPARKRKRNSTTPQIKNVHNNRRNSRDHSGSNAHSVKKDDSYDGSCGSNAENDHIGHHSGTPGTTIKDRYEIVREIGMGTFGKVFTCFDLKHKDMVAIKIVRSIKRYVESAKIEADILDHVYDHQAKSQSNHCLKLYSHFKFDNYYCLVTEKLGPSLYDILKENKYKGFPMRIIREVARQLLQAMQFLKSMNLIHTDLKVENVLFVGDLEAVRRSGSGGNKERGGGDRDGGGGRYRGEERRRDGDDRDMNRDRNRDSERDRDRDRDRDRIGSNGGGGRGGREFESREQYPASSQIKIIDFGGATYDNDKKSTVINTRQYRSPEVLLETSWSFPSDIWSVGCILAEIYAGGLLFQTHGNLEHLALVEKCCGLFPFRMLKESDISREYFDHQGKTKLFELNRESQGRVQDMRRLRDVFALDDKHRDRSGLADLMEALLEVDPRRRATASQALQMTFVR